MLTDSVVMERTRRRKWEGNANEGEADEGVRS